VVQAADNVEADVAEDMKFVALTFGLMVQADEVTLVVVALPQAVGHRAAFVTDCFRAAGIAARYYRVARFDFAKPPTHFSGNKIL
jgi:hypothetical protein